MIYNQFKIKFKSTNLKNNPFLKVKIEYFLSNTCLTKYNIKIDKKLTMNHFWFILQVNTLTVKLLLIIYILSKNCTNDYQKIKTQKNKYNSNKTIT